MNEVQRLQNVIRDAVRTLSSGFAVHSPAPPEPVWQDLPDLDWAYWWLDIDQTSDVIYTHIDWNNDSWTTALGMVDCVLADWLKRWPCRWLRAPAPPKRKSP